MNTRKTAGLILAAGTSSRMERFKPLLPLGGKTVIEQVIARFRAAGIETIRVVTGHRASELTPLLENIGVERVQNHGYSKGMFSSVKAGVDSIPLEAEAFFLLPADIPLVRASTLTALLEAGGMGSERIFYPTFDGVRGHPPLISTVYRRQIHRWAGRGGMRGFLQSLDAEATEVAVADEGILFDLDTPDDYRQAEIRADNFNTPTTGECLALMRIHFGPDAPVTGHSRAVAEIALKLAAALNRAGCTLDPELIRAASLVHDVAKGAPDHAAAGALLLSDIGFSRVSEVVREHMDLITPIEGPIEEKELVYLADKLVEGALRVDLSARFDGKLKRYAHDPGKSAAISRRLNNAVAVKVRIEARLGQPLESTLNQLGG